MNKSSVWRVGESFVSKFYLNETLNLTGTYGGGEERINLYFCFQILINHGRCPQEKFIIAKWYRQSSPELELLQDIFYNSCCSIPVILETIYFRLNLSDLWSITKYNKPTDTAPSKPIMKNYLPFLIGNHPLSSTTNNSNKYLEDFATFWHIFR